ncbi:nitrate- and nitrite sensing domain-containing protein [Streptomyces sp. NBC_00250]|uniref:sensor histidine kinase n=1 Tax=Streptomyces sp. NBC_00250 TaxID=2903641 RepID=UPI002E2C9068|nr:nitrate- and nitrite sensing domain-containing protein [Streptomyces sp. NBC_00250]
MRAPVQMKRPRSKNGTRSQTPGAASTPDDGAATAPTGNAATGHPVQPQAPAQPKPPAGRPKRVRNRLVAGVALVGITVIVAGAPAILAASAELNDSQSLVTLAELDRQAVTLAHSLADERDEVVAYIAAGRDAQSGKNKRQITSTRSTRVDRQIDEIRPAASAELRRDLAGVPSVRRTALTGKGTALEAHRAYSEVIAKLQALADELADKTPARASDTALTEATRAPAALGRAVEQASATRGLLLAALSVPQPEPTGDVHYDPETGTYVPDVPEGAAEADRARDTLTAAAQQARVRELAALGDFDQAAGAAARDSLAATVAGPDVKSAERSLATLTDQPRLTDTERETDPAGVEAALSARIEQMRGVESALAAEQVERLGALRDDDVTALELRIAFLGGCLLVAVGISTYVARTLTRPLAVLRIGAARLAAAPAPHTEEPVRFTGRNDEFAQVVRSLNTLRGKLSDLAAQNERLTERLTDGQADLTAAKEALGAELATQRAELQGQVALLTADLEGLRGTVHHTFVNLSLRSLGLVERQLGVIEKLEEREQDPDRLATLFKLDHMATVMRRHSENLLVLAGHEHVHGHPGPVPLVDVLRAAVSEIERYERVTIQSLPPHAQIAGFAADDLSHLVAELLENATSFSPPDAEVQLSGWLLESGEVMLSVQDAGIGMTASRLAELNARLAEADPAAFEGEGLGMRVVALLAARHGVRVELREQQPGGTAAVVVLPQPLLPAALPTTVTEPVRVAGAAPTLHLPGSAAEANSNTLPSRTRDPLVEAAERAFMAAEVTAAREQQNEPEPEPESLYEPEPEPAYEEPRQAHEEALPAYEELRQAHEETEPAYEEAVPAPAALGESVSETTLQVRLPDPPPEPDAHERATDLAAAEIVTDLVTEPAPYEEPSAPPAPEPVSDQPVPGPRAAQWERVTDKGLPKRTPQVVRPAGPATTPRQGGVDAEALRRRLGGFHQGAKAGRRDVEAEMDTARTEAVRTARTEEMTGDTVEEARS